MEKRAEAESWRAQQAAEQAESDRRDREAEYRADAEQQKAQRAAEQVESDRRAREAEYRAKGERWSSGFLGNAAPIIIAAAAVPFLVNPILLPVACVFCMCIFQKFTRFIGAYTSLSFHNLSHIFAFHWCKSKNTDVIRSCCVTFRGSTHAAHLHCTQ